MWGKKCTNVGGKVKKKRSAVDPARPEERKEFGTVWKRGKIGENFNSRVNPFLSS